MGPSLAALLDNYDTVENAWLVNTEFFNATDGVQLWTVPKDGTYRIIAYGAQGGKAGVAAGSGGLGAKIEGDFDLEAGTKLRIVVGQMGGISTGQSGGGGYYGDNNGGGGGAWTGGSEGGGGAVRIVWPGNVRKFPNINIGEIQL